MIQQFLKNYYLLSLTGACCWIEISRFPRTDLCITGTDGAVLKSVIHSCPEIKRVKWYSLRKNGTEEWDELLFGIVAHFGYFNTGDVEVAVAQQRHTNSTRVQNAEVIVPLEFDTLDSTHIITADV